MSATMRALTMDDGRLVLRTDYPVPVPSPGEALIRLQVGGICSTDLEIVKGYGHHSGVLGHEFVGVIEACGTAEDNAWIGRRVVGTINIGCRACPVCLSDGPEHCPTRTVLGIIGHDGAFADYLTLPVANLLAVPDSLPDEDAVFTEPLAAALRIRQQIRVRPADRAAVVGPGRLGLLIAQVLALAGGRVDVLGRAELSLALPASLGLPVGLSVDQPDNGYDLVVEATGNNAGFAESLRLVRPQGTLVLKSTFVGSSDLDLTKLVVGEIKVIGSRCGPFEPALRLLAESSAGRSGVQVRPLVDAAYSLSEGLAAFAHAARPGVRKVLLRP